MQENFRAKLAEKIETLNVGIADIQLSTLQE